MRGWVTAVTITAWSSGRNRTGVLRFGVKLFGFFTGSLRTSFASQNFAVRLPSFWGRFLCGLEMGDFLPVGRENGLGTIFVTGVDWYKHGGGFSVVWKSSELESSDSEIGLTLGFFCYEKADSLRFREL